MNVVVDLPTAQWGRGRVLRRSLAGAGGWLSAVSRAVAAAALTAAAGLVLWSLLPHALGLQSHVVVSGSMHPRIAAGDVVLTQRAAADDLHPGQVVLFADPEGEARLVLHRLVAVTEGGALVTRGDANQSADSTPVPAAQVRGLARLRVPYIGLPVLWRDQGQPGRVVALLVLLTAATAMVCGERRAAEAGGTGAGGRAASAWCRTARGRRRRR